MTTDKKLSKSEFEKIANKLAREIITIYECKKCGYPVVTNLCCTGCGNSNPKMTFEEEQKETEKKQKEEKKISLNLWDDYDEDEDGTYMYFENDEDPSLEDQKTILGEICDFIQEKKLLDKNFYYIDFQEIRNWQGNLEQRYQLIFVKLPHTTRKILVRKLQKRGFTYKMIPLHIYSES